MYQYYQPTRIHFGCGALAEVARISKKYGQRCLLVTTADEVPLKTVYDRIKELLAAQQIKTVHFDQVRPNPNTEMLNQGIQLCRESQPDFILAVGGGSSIDSGKILASTYGSDRVDWEKLFNHYSSPFEQYPSISQAHLPIIAIPTTSGTGSQLTQAAVISRGEEKLTIFHPDHFPEECIIDPELLISLPPRLTAATGFDAFTHAFESYVNPRSSLFGRIQARKAMELIIKYLPPAVCDGTDLEARIQMAYADSLAGAALANGGADLPHPLSEIIGGLTGIPHGEALAIVFPAYCRVMAKHKASSFAEIASLFNENLKTVPDHQAAEQLPALVSAFLKEIGILKKLSDFNISREKQEVILNHPVLNHLPFATFQECLKVLKGSV